jgi:hypothetical protein
MPPGRSAADATVKDALDQLDGAFAGMAEGVSQDLYALWLGSGISFGRVEGLPELVPRVLHFLQQHVAVGDPDCPFRAALATVFTVASVSAADRAIIDAEKPIHDWPGIDSIIDRLVGNYARFLDTVVDDQDDDYLLWEAAEVRTTYGDPSIEPDAEHLCIGLLILEGVASDIPSANWDGLIEKAVTQLTNGAPALAVCVDPEDLRGPQLQARFYKFHGCAVRARADERKYRPLLIARQSQINGWTARNAPLVNRLIDIATTKSTLMIGLSAQDANIQAIFAEAETRMEWPWPSDRPAYVFSADSLGVDQRGLLKNVYHGVYNATTRDDIYTSALIRAYAKSMLGALVLQVLSIKIRTLIELAPGNLQPAHRAALYSGVVHLRNVIATAAQPTDAAFVRRAVVHAARIGAMFHEGDATNIPLPYRPITSRPVQQMAGDVGLLATGLREFAVAIGLLGVGLRAGHWAIETVEPSDPRAGALRVVSAAGIAKLFLAGNAHAAARLKISGHLTDDDNAIVIHSREITVPMPRSPRGTMGRTGHPGIREVSISTLLNEVSDDNELLDRFRKEVVV